MKYIKEFDDLFLNDDTKYILPDDHLKSLALELLKPVKKDSKYIFEDDQFHFLDRIYSTYGLKRGRRICHK
jgi:hypothetical protein